MSAKAWVLSLAVSMLLTGEAEPAKAPVGPTRNLMYEEPRSLSGAIYCPGNEVRTPCFRFQRYASRSGMALEVQRDFTYPDGKLAAQERLLYEGDALVSYELDEAQMGASGRASIHRAGTNSTNGSIEFEYTRGPLGRAKVRTEALRENTLVADMVGVFLASHWEALRRGDKVKCRYIVVPRLETVGFTFVKDSESMWQGREVVILRMEASSLFVAALVDPLVFTMEATPPHRVLQYVGRTTPKIRAGAQWKDLDAMTVFDWESAR